MENDAEREMRQSMFNEMMEWKAKALELEITNSEQKIENARLQLLQMRGKK